jgi:hypothetical protein
MMVVVVVVVVVALVVVVVVELVVVSCWQWYQLQPVTTGFLPVHSSPRISATSNHS